MCLCLITKMDFFIQLLILPKFLEKVTYFVRPEGPLWRLHVRQGCLGGIDLAPVAGVRGPDTAQHLGTSALLGG